MATPTRRTAKWYAADMTLDDEPIILADGTFDQPFLSGATGLAARQYAVSLSSSPGVRGARFERAIEKPSTVTLVVLIEGATYGEFRRKRDDLIDALSPVSGPGMLELSADLGTDSGEIRWASAVYLSGLEGAEDTRMSGPTYWIPTITFQLLDLWHSMEPTVASWSGKQGYPWFQPFPYYISPSGLDVVEALEVDGSPKVDMWPEWELTGPYATFEATGPRGESWSVEGIEAGEIVTVTTDPNGVIDVVSSTAGRSWSRLRAGYQLWPLRRDDAVTLDATGTSSASRVKVTVPKLWNSAP